jgi:amino-acid N-acetyltransferase
VEVVLGVCGLNIIWADMAEVYALAVRPSARGRGLGGRLVRACLDEAGTLGIRRQMTLTYEQQFFERLGFRVVDRQQLPLKVWSQCVRCSKNAACDEIAMIHVHESVPACEAAPPPERERYEVPVPLTIRRSLVTGAARPKMDELVEPRRP